MSKRILGIVPKSGERLVKEAIGQFKGIIAQLEEGIKKVAEKVTANDKKVAKIQAESERLLAASKEAAIAKENLQAILSGKIVAIPTEDEIIEEEIIEEETAEDTVENEAEDTPSEETK